MCNPSLRRLCGALSGSRRGVVELLSALLAVNSLAPLGRGMLARLLGIGDKRARNILAELAKRGLVEPGRGGATPKDWVSDALAYTLCTELQGRTVAAARCDGEPPRSIIRLRDAIVLSLGDPEALEALGFVEKGEAKLPGMPEELAARYSGLLEEAAARVAGEGGYVAVAVFSRPSCYRCCASLLHALILCSSPTTARSL